MSKSGAASNMPEGTVLSALIREWRPHQWVKNILVFVPMLAAHQFTDTLLWGRCILAFGAFCAVCSAVYTFNDLIDVEADRAHPSKCRRPIASGALPSTLALLSAILLLSTALGLSTLLDSAFGLVLLTYFMASTVYTLWGKKVLVLDLVILAVLYTLRVVAGGAAAQVVVSEWLLALCLFFFFSLGCIKRYAELYNQSSENASGPLKGRGYELQDLAAIGTFGAASASMTVLVMALYITNSDTSNLYGRPYILWLICPLLLYWVTRIWLITYRGKMDDDPVLFAIRDRCSYVVAGMVISVGLLAI